MPALAGHQPYAFDAKNPSDGFKLRAQRLELQVDQVRAKQIDRIALITAHLAALDVDAVGHQQVEDVTQDANPVLAVDFDTHGARLGCVFIVGASLPRDLLIFLKDREASSLLQWCFFVRESIWLSRFFDDFAITHARMTVQLSRRNELFTEYAHHSGNRHVCPAASGQHLGYHLTHEYAPSLTEQ